MFDAIAPNYDKLNRIMTARLDIYWRWQLIRNLRKSNPSKILDVACGTGDLSLMMASRIPTAQAITGIDISSEMLAIAEKKLQKKKVAGSVQFAQADCLSLPFPNHSFDAATCAFGVRNFENTEQGLREMARVLSPEGKLLILELSTPPNYLMRKGYNLYAYKVIPFLGRLIAHDTQAYEYLPRSIEAMPQREQMVDIILRSGFSTARYISLSGGVATLYIASR